MSRAGTMLAACAAQPGLLSCTDGYHLMQHLPSYCIQTCGTVCCRHSNAVLLCEKDGMLAIKLTLNLLDM